MSNFEDEQFHDADAQTDDDPMQGFVNLIIWCIPPAAIALFIYVVRNHG